MSIFSIIILSLSIFSTISAQLQATESEALVELNIGNMEKKARSGEIIHFVNQKNGKIYETISNATGKAALLLPEGFTYDIKIAGLGEEEEYSTIEIPSATGKHKLSLELNYEPAHVYTLEDVQFDVNSAILRSSSFKSLDQLVKVLKNKPDLHIEIAGHTDDDGEEEANLILSQNRAEAVQSYLIQKGIDKKRLTAKGYGETQPITENDLPENKQKNRRTEVRIID